MNEYNITLIGHRDISSEEHLDSKLYSLLYDLTKERSYLNFYIGRHGGFDIMAASVVKSLQKNIGKENIALTLVLPYHVSDIEYYGNYYDGIIIPQSLHGIHPKSAITKRNIWMADECDLLICFVQRKNGGAYTALKHALSIGKPVINLADRK